MESDAWGELFAKAADVGSSQAAMSESSDGPQTHDDDEGRRSRDDQHRKRKKNKKRRRNEMTGDDSADFFQEMLRNRIRPPGEHWECWPTWLRLKGALVKTKGNDECNGWAFQSSSPLTDKYAKCQKCDASDLYHRVEVTEEASKSWPFLAFQNLRNLRCTASLLAQKYQSMRTPSHIQCLLGGDDTWISINSIRARLSENSGAISSLKTLVWRQLPEAEARIVDSKLNDVIRQSTLILNSIPQDKKGKRMSNEKMPVSSHWEPSIRLITAVDALYYRLYYLQIVQLLPACLQDGKHQQLFLPHPSDYFELSVPTLPADKIPSSSQGNQSWSEELMEDYKVLDAKEHPLCAIHRMRLAETSMLFRKSGWSTSAIAKELTLKSLGKFNDGEEKHETPAPNVLMEWRDGCRDYLCNLYSYATLSPKVIDKIVSFLSERDPKLGIIEIGAGTGYIAKLLEERGVSVDAWDIHPTSEDVKATRAMNEYHGNTPPFIEVKKGSKLPNVNCKNRALLLCYPPPGSPMAHDTLQTYLQNGGRVLIHIGEWKGLTGDKRFESLLAREMVCQSRHPTLTWGTDSSHATIWTKAGKESSASSLKLLLPCSKCEIREGTRRCRLLRSLVYCSQKCFEDDSDLRSKKLQSQCICLNSETLSFTNTKHFMPLS